MQWAMRLIAWVGCWLVLGTNVARAAAPPALSVMLTVRETAGVGRRQAPVSGGIPLPREANVLRADQLALFGPDGRTPVDCQFTVLSRWFGKREDASQPIAWVRLDFLADVPAEGTVLRILRQAPDQGGGRVETRGAEPAAPVERAAPHGAGLAITDTDDRLVVDTGILKVTVSKRRFTVIESAEVRGVPVVQPDAGNGLVVVRSQGSRYYSSTAVPTRVAVEQQGQQTAVVRIEGSLVPGTHNQAFPGQLDRLDVDVWLRFFHGRSDVWATVRVGYPEKASAQGLVGRGARAAHEFRELALSLVTRVAAPVECAFGTDGGASVPVRLVAGEGGASSSARLVQGGAGGPTSPAGFVLRRGGQADLTGRRAPGWMHFKGTNAGVTLAIRRFWEEYPRSLSAEATGAASVGLLAEQENAVHSFEGGRRKTHNLLLAFHGPGEAAGAAAVDFLHPLRVAAAPEWYVETEAVEPFAVEDDDLFRVYEDLVRSIVHTEDGRGTRAYERDSKDDYGWMNFGDASQGGSRTGRLWANNPQDLAYALLVQSLRRGALSEAFFDEGEAAVRHQVDVDTYSTMRDELALAGGTRAPDTPGRPEHGGLPSLNDTGVDGVVLYYHLTGEPWARAAALDWGRWVAANQRRGEPGVFEVSVRPGGLAAILNGLAALYQLSGDENDLSLLKAVVTQSVLARQGGGGYLVYQTGGAAEAVDPPETAALAAALGRYARLCRERTEPDPRAETAITNLLMFLLKEAWSATDIHIGGRKYPAGLATTWYSDQRPRRFDRVVAQTALDAIGYADLLSSERSKQEEVVARAGTLYTTAFADPPTRVYYRDEQPDAARRMAELIRCTPVGLYAIQQARPRVDLLSAELADLTKFSQGPYVVRVRLRNVPAAAMPQLDYALDAGEYAGWRPMRPVAGRPGVWECEIPDLGWGRLASHRLNYRVRLAPQEGQAAEVSRLVSELIDSLDLPPRLVKRVPPIEFRSGESAAVYLGGFARDSEDPVEALEWSVGDVDEALLQVRLDAAHQRLILEARPGVSGTDTITLVVRDRRGQTAEQSVRVIVQPP